MGKTTVKYRSGQGSKYGLPTKGQQHVGHSMVLKTQDSLPQNKLCIISTVFLHTPQSSHTYVCVKK